MPVFGIWPRPQSPDTYLDITKIRLTLLLFYNPIPHCCAGAMLLTLCVRDIVLPAVVNSNPLLSATPVLFFKDVFKKMLVCVRFPPSPFHLYTICTVTQHERDKPQRRVPQFEGFGRQYFNVPSQLSVNQRFSAPHSTLSSSSPLSPLPVILFR